MEPDFADALENRIERNHRVSESPQRGGFGQGEGGTHGPLICESSGRSAVL